MGVDVRWKPGNRMAKIVPVQVGILAIAKLMDVHICPRKVSESAINEKDK